MSALAEANPIRVLVESPQFTSGLIWGCAATVLLVAIAVVARDRVAPVGAGFAAAALIALERSGNIAAHQAMPRWVAVGTALSFVLVEIAAHVDRRMVVLTVAAAPGALVVAGALVGVPTWVRVVVACFATFGAALVADADRVDRPGVAPGLWLIAVAGVYWTVPDTEAARVAIGVALPIAATGWPWGLGRLGAGGAAASVCVLGWVIGQDGFGRPGAVVGGVACLGLFIYEPILRRVGRVGFACTGRALTVAYVAAAQLACVAAASRWAGLAAPASTAMLRALAFLPVAFALTFAIDAIDATQELRASPRPRRQ
jgi:hypothetical protein